MKSSVRVLVVDDEPAVRSALKRALELDGYTVLLANDGQQAIDRLREDRVDAVVLDVAMPVLDGIQTTRRLRDIGDRTPILMLTARDAIDDRVEGLDVGADDYLTKPFALRELHARLRALLRRVESPTEEMRFGDLRLDPMTRDVYRGERRLELSRTEYNLLELFMQHPRQVLTRTAIYERIWDYDLGATSSVLGVYIGYLRRKTEAGGEDRMLHTVRGVGYALREHA
jgi:two-component system response regulator MprA